MREKRQRYEIFYSIAKIISIYCKSEKNLRPTQIQLYAGLSYDKAQQFIKMMNGYNLITRNPYTLTNKGRIFLKFTECELKNRDNFHLEIFNKKKNVDLFITSKDEIDYSEILKQKQQIIHAQAAIITELEKK